MNNTGVKGLNFWTVLFLLILGLKLAQVGLVANWNWVWVFAPLWGPTALWAAVSGAVALVGWWARRGESQEEKNIRKARKTLDSYASNFLK